MDVLSQRLGGFVCRRTLIKQVRLQIIQLFGDAGLASRPPSVNKVKPQINGRRDLRCYDPPSSTIRMVNDNGRAVRLQFLEGGWMCCGAFSCQEACRTRRSAPVQTDVFNFTEAADLNHWINPCHVEERASQNRLNDDDVIRQPATRQRCRAKRRPSVVRNFLCKGAEIRQLNSGTKFIDFETRERIINRRAGPKLSSGRK